MEPELPESYMGRATLTDLLDRVLDKGLFLRADLVISVAGIPLIGVTLNAVVAGIETLLEYGIMSDWDNVRCRMSDVGCRMGDVFSIHNTSDIPHPTSDIALPV